MKKTKQIARFLLILTTDPALLFSFLKNSFYFLRNARRNNIVFISLIEHMGDIIAAEPIIGALRIKHSNEKFIWIITKPFAPVVEVHPEINDVLNVTCLTEWIALRKLTRIKKLYDLHISGRTCSKYGFAIQNENADHITTDNYYHHGNLLHCFSRTAEIAIDDTIAPTIYFSVSKKHSLSKTIVIHTSSNASERMWNSTGWQQLVNFINKNFPSFTIYEVGFKKQVTTSSSNYIDFTGHRPLSEIADLVSNCSFFTGIDSGFAHMANALRKKSLILLGRYGPFSSYNPYSGYFLGQSEQFLFYFDGLLSDMTFDEISFSIQERLKAV